MSETYYNFSQPKKRFFTLKKIFISGIFLLLLGAVFYGSFFSYKFYSVSKKIISHTDGASDNPSLIKTLKNIASEKQPELNGTEKNRINILLLGIAGEGKPGRNLADTIMIASFNLETGKVALLSIPRDLYVEISSEQLKKTGVSMKINSVYQYGISNAKDDSSNYATAIKKTLENITSLPIDYYAIINFDGFQKIIDGIGGINIMNERDIFDPRYPGPNYSYETFELKKGFHHLDGAAALKYARERHNDPEGDFGRAKRQQQVLQAAKNKIFSAGTYLNVFALNDIFNALENNVLTDIKPEEIGEFLRLAKKLDTQNIVNVVADAWNKDSLLKVSHIFYGNTRSFILVPRIGNWSELQDLAQNIFELDKIKKRQEEIEKEAASVLLVNRSGDKTLPEKIKTILENKLRISTVDILTERNTTLSAETLIADNAGGEKIFTLDEIIKKLPARLDKSASTIVNLGKKPDFIIIMGKDLAEAHNFEEDSIEEYNQAEMDNF